MNMEQIAQVGIGICGVTGVFLSQSKSREKQRYACLFGMASQPFWFYSSFVAEQWGVFALSFLYAGSWIRGFINHWIRKS